MHHRLNRALIAMGLTAALSSVACVGAPDDPDAEDVAREELATMPSAILGYRGTRYLGYELEPDGGFWRIGTVIAGGEMRLAYMPVARGRTCAMVEDAEEADFTLDWPEHASARVRFAAGATEVGRIDVGVVPFALSEGIQVPADATSVHVLYEEVGWSCTGVDISVFSMGQTAGVSAPAADAQDE